MSFKVLRPGLLSSLQDIGRIGYQKYGINVSGAMDVLSLRLANILVGNKENEAALEITMTGPTLEFLSDTLIAIVGANLSPVIDGVAVRMNRPVAVKAGAVLKFGACQKGCRAYLAAAGGYDVPEVMGSKSTYLRGGLGGYQGRALQKGDIVDCGKPSSFGEHTLHFLLMKGARSFRIANWFVNPPHMEDANLAAPIRLTKGMQMEAYKDECVEAFLQETFKVTTSADRLGYRMQGPQIELKAPLEMISEVATFGSVQVPPDGNPIILMADHQSVAGYPKIAQVISADLARVAQYKPGSRMSFRLISVEEAEEICFEQERYLESVKIAVMSKC